MLLMSDDREFLSHIVGLEMVAKSLEDEPSINIGSLVFSSLTDLSNKTSACSVTNAL